MSELIQAPMDYKPKRIPISRYRYNKMNLNSTSSTSFPLQSTSTTQINWKLPPNTVYNLSRSFIEYQYSVPQVASNYGFTYENNQDFCNYIGYTDNSNANIVDLNNADRYSQMNLPISIPQEQFAVRDPTGIFYPSTGAVWPPIGITGTFTTNQVGLTGTYANVFPCDVTGLTGATGGAGLQNYLPAAQSMQYLACSTGTNTALNRSRILKLGDFFKGTYFGCDKNTITPSDMFINCNLQYANRIAFYSTTCPPNLASCQSVSTANQTITFYNVYLYLAIETNKEIVDNLKASLKAGSIRYPIPWTYCTKTPVSGTSSGTTLTITKAFGHTLKRIMNGVFNGNENGTYLGQATMQDRSNLNGVKVTSYQSALNSTPLTSQFLNCFNPNPPYLGAVVFAPAGSGWVSTIPSTVPYGDDYRENLRYLAGSSLVNYYDYQINWFHIDDFSDLSITDKKSLNINVPDENIVDGLDLKGGDITYALTLNTPCIVNANNNTASSLNLYQFQLFERDLIISPEGMLMA